MPDVYTETVVSHFRHPRNAGVLEAPDAVGYTENPASGAVLKLYLKVAEDRIVRATFLAQGCTATIAAGSALTEMLTGRTIAEAAGISHAEIEGVLGGLPPTRRHAALLAEDALRSAIDAYQKGGVDAACDGPGGCPV